MSWNKEPRWSDRPRLMWKTDLVVAATGMVIIIIVLVAWALLS